MLRRAGRLFSDLRDIRNFCIVAHIDHGKSTLADRFLELTQTVKKVSHAQVLDTLQIEQERGITIRAQTVAMRHQGKLLNLIDTPGHVDFSYEVSRSLRACQGCILLVDATAGVQAQTFSNFYQAFEAGLTIIPALNKVDHPAAEVQVVEDQVKTHFDLTIKHRISALSGLGVSSLLDDVIATVPPPEGDPKADFRGFLFDSWYHSHRGVVCLISVKDGIVRKGEFLRSLGTGLTYTVQELGLPGLELKPQPHISAGQVGYFLLSMKKTAEALIGDTFVVANSKVTEPFPGFKPPKCMVFAGAYPEDPDNFGELQVALDRYLLQDRSVMISKHNSEALGSGFRCGFLGLLHMDIFRQRLDMEYQQPIIITAPSVTYEIELKTGQIQTVDNANLLPDRFHIKSYREPVVEATIVTPSEYTGDIVNFCLECRGSQADHVVLDTQRALLKFRLPLAEIIMGFFDSLKSLTRGMATLDYELVGYFEADVGLFTILLNGKMVDALSSLVHREKAASKGKNMVDRLKEILPQQLFEVAIQATFQGKIIARSTMKALRKDVTAKCYGGDQSRKRKLLDRQKEGKRKMREIGKVRVDADTFHQLLRIK